MFFEKRLKSRILGVDRPLTQAYKPAPLFSSGNETKVVAIAGSLGADWKSWKHFGRDSRAVVRENVPFFVKHKVSLLNFFNANFEQKLTNMD